MMSNKRYIPTLANDGHHVSTYILRDKITGRFVSHSILKSSLIKSNTDIKEGK
jgi:hypothetical protein